MGLKELRKKRDLSQDELAILSQVNKRTIQQYEQGVVDINQAAAIKLYKLSKVLKCRMEDLLNLDTIDSSK